jgi:alpha-beta hydrolase superfamily lysophospholipase
LERLVLMTTAVIATPVSMSLPNNPPDESWFLGSDGVKLFEGRWRPSGEARACLVIVHGLKDYGGRYAELANALASRGVAVHAADLRGHGRSDGERVWIRSFDEYLSDLDLVVNRAREAYPGRPIFLFGHSMGGTIVTLYTITRRPDLGGLILSAGSLKPAAGLTPRKVRKAKLLSMLTPRRRTLKLQNDQFSRDPAVVARMSTDPMVDDRPGPARTAAQLIKARETLQPREGSVTVPLLVLHGSADKVTNPEGSREFVARAASGDKTLKIYDGFYHDLLHEPDHSQVLADIVEWIVSRTP